MDRLVSGSSVEWDQLEHPEHDPDRSALDSADAAEISGGIFDRLIFFQKKRTSRFSLKTRACISSEFDLKKGFFNLNPWNDYGNL